MSDDVETKLSAARTRLILDKPFLGALVLRLPMVAADPKWCKTTATDARSFYYSRAYIKALTLDETQFMLAHEALHCALSHFARRQHRIKHRWDVACDFAINPLLVDDDLKPPPGTLLLDNFHGMTAEEIYPLIDDDNDDETLDQHLYDQDDKQEKEQETKPRRERYSDPESGRIGEPSINKGEIDPNAGGAPQPPTLSEREREALSVQWQQRLAGAAQQAMQAGKLGGSLARLVDHLLQPQLPWRSLLARYLTAVARDDYNFMRPSSRREGAAILPSLRSTQIELVVILDTSGSISRGQLHEFLAEVDAIKGQLRARIALHACDERLAENGPWIYEAWEEISLPDALQGGGGTRFTPAFAWADTLDRPPDLLLYFTDANGEFPKKEPDYSVIWLVKGKLPVPWGQRIQLN
jgi:predicted metal-dependent peptidase